MEDYMNKVQSPLFVKVINKLMKLRFGFEVNNTYQVSIDDPIAEYLSPTDLGEDHLYLRVPVSNMEYVVYEYDDGTLSSLLEELEDYES